MPKFRAFVVIPSATVEFKAAPKEPEKLSELSEAYSRLLEQGGIVMLGDTNSPSLENLVQRIKMAGDYRAKVRGAYKIIPGEVNSLPAVLVTIT